jgi:phosphoglucomutase
MANGGPAPDAFTDKIYALSQSLDQYRICPELACDFAQLGTSQYTVEGGHSFTVDVIDPCADYVELMKSIFDFDQVPVAYKLHCLATFSILWILSVSLGS